MKKVATILLTISLLAGISYVNTSCEVYQEDVSLSVSPTSLTFKADEITSKTLNITTDANLWKATADVHWVKILDLGDRIEVSVEKYEALNTPNRYATITINADGLKHEIKVTQNAKLHLELTGL